MNLRFASIVLSLVVAASFDRAAAVTAAGETGPQVAHMVYFTLADDTPENAQKLVAACKKYLDGHEGTVYFSVGTLAKDKDFEREVNDREFHVALHLVFADKAAHDKYLPHARHLEFIDKNKQLWSKVRVFDAYVETSKEN